MKKLVTVLLATVFLFAALVPVLGVSAATTPTPVVYSNDKVKVDATYASSGYISVNYTASTTMKVKITITGPRNVQYQFNSGSGKTEILPLSEGDGTYAIGVFTQVDGNKYSTTYTVKIDVKLKDQFSPFLVSNQYVNYTAKSKTIEKAAELVKDKEADLDRITAIYDYVVGTFTYDKDKAAQVTSGSLSGYLPDVDTILAAKKGICFDYAAVMTAMFRSQNIPCKLVVGYAGDLYHAWISAYTKEAGWIDNLIQFDGKEWKIMDPTFDSTSRNSKGQISDSMKQFIGDGSNYSPKYFY